VAWYPVECHWDAESFESEGGVVYCAGELLTGAACQAGGAYNCRLIVCKEVDAAALEAVKVNVFVACHEALVDGPQLGVEYFGGCAHGDDGTDVPRQSFGYVVSCACVPSQLGAISVGYDVGFVAVESVK
jgi:hypothetical protein